MFGTAVLGAADGHGDIFQGARRNQHEDDHEAA